MLKSKVGYSNNTSAFDAGVEAANMVSDKLNPKIALVFNSTGYNQTRLLDGIKSILPDTNIVGCTSSMGIITPDGYITDDTGSVGIMALDDDDMMVATFGMAKKKSARETGREVAIRALEEASIDYAPDYFYMSANPLEEEEYIKGIQDVIGRVPCFGGSTADNDFVGNWSIFYNGNIFTEGCVVAFFYTPKKVVTKFASAYNETSDMGVITKVNNKNTLVEIDGMLALDKYKKWCKLKNDDLKGSNLGIASLTNPLGVKDRLGNLTAIRYPISGNDDGSIDMGSNLAIGTAVIHMEASIDDLINSTENILRELKKECPNASAYLLVHSGRYRLCIGDRMNEVYDRLKKEAGNIPFLVMFSSSEYGYSDEQNNVTGNLMLSFTAFEK